MKIGDLVKYYDGLNDDTRTGLVLEIVNHNYKGTFTPSFWTAATVLWSDGQLMLCEPDELRIVSESR